MVARVGLPSSADTGQRAVAWNIATGNYTTKGFEELDDLKDAIQSWINGGQEIVSSWRLASRGIVARILREAKTE